MIEPIQFESCGVTLEGRLHFPEGSQKSKAIVIILTGDSPSGLKSKTWPPMIAALNDMNLTVFAFDFLSQGFSEGQRTALTLSVGCKNLLDSLRALSLRLDLSVYKIGFLGSSFGGTVILTEHRRIGTCHAIALKSPASFLPEAYESEHEFASGMEAWRAAGTSAICGLSYNAYLDAINHNVYSLVADLRVPTLIVHGADDSTVPVRQSRRLRHLIGANARLIELPGVNHDYKQPGAQDRMQREVVTFFAETLLSEKPTG